MTFEKAVEVYGSFLKKSGDNSDPKKSILEFLDWVEDPDDDIYTIPSALNLTVQGNITYNNFGRSYFDNAYNDEIFHINIVADEYFDWTTYSIDNQPFLPFLDNTYIPIPKKVSGDWIISEVRRTISIIRPPSRSRQRPSGTNQRELRT